MNRKILFTAAYPAADSQFFTLVKLNETSGVVLANVCEVYASSRASAKLFILFITSMIYISLNYPYLSIDGVNFAEALLLTHA